LEGSPLKVRYSPKEDILMYEISDYAIDYPEEMDSVIVHFTKAGKSVLLEIWTHASSLRRRLRRLRPAVLHNN
jgi:hypothetical protein